MSNKNTLDERKLNHEEPDSELLNRREFLQTSVTGVGLTALGATALGATALGVAALDSGANEQGHVNRANGDLVDICPDECDTVDIDPNNPNLVDTWSEPWVWRPNDWPNKDLDLVVVQNAAPFSVTGSGFENINPLLLSYGGTTPGPTIRMSGDETLSLELRNMLGLDSGKSFTGPYPDPVALPSGVSSGDIPQDAEDDWCLGEHTNGVHSVNTTNLHTHGLHVRPGLNPDGTVSDNIILRVMPQADFQAREDAADPNCRFLRVNEQVGSASYEFRLGNLFGTGEPHAPGTHWYHPHAHGATHNQVASGMAGFLIIEGDVDEAINQQLTGSPTLPDPQIPTGNFNYRERLIFMQNVNPGNTAVDPDNPAGGVRRAITFPVVNGSFLPKIMLMQPGTIERWRVLNGSVDGRGYLRFFVLKGQFQILENNQLGEVNADGSCSPLDSTTIEALKVPLSQLAMDGVTLVRETASGGAEYFIKSLDFSAAPNPLDLKSTDTSEDRITKISNCYANADNIKAAYIRPNEVLLAPANRTDLFFTAPQLQNGETSAVYTVCAQLDILHNDNYDKGLRFNVANGNNVLPDWPKSDVVVANIVVKGDPVPGGPIDVTALPPVPEYLLPISDAEIQVTSSGEAAARDVELGTFRTRVITYSGWGNADFPIIDVPQSYVEQNPDFLNVTYGPITPGSDQIVLLPANIRTMSIDGRKFDPVDPIHPRMWLNSSEEWAVYNNSVSLWNNTTETVWQQPNHYYGQPVTRSQAEDLGLDLISTTTVDHPFHIHVNPFWLSRHEVVIADGSLVNILDEPRWQDVVWLPRNRGRAVFRSRFTDYVGEYVNHCHILLHEDNGMMQLVEVVAAAEDSNYVARFEVTEAGMSSPQVSDIYPRVTLNQAFIQNASFIDPNPSTGQTYPGFDCAIWCLESP